MTRPISPRDISLVINSFPQKPDIEDLFKVIAKQSEIIEGLREEIKDDNSFTSKLKDYLIGGIIGALIGIVIGYLFSLL